MFKSKFSSKETKASKTEALEQIKKFLDAEDVDGQFANRDGNYYGKDKFLVTWNNNYNTIPSEYGLDLCDSFYTAFSGNKCIYVTRSLIHEKQLKGYRSIERGLIEVGMKLCSTKEQKKEFFNKYATKYNERISKNQQHEMP